MATFKYSIFLDRYKPSEYGKINEMLNEIAAEAISLISNFKDVTKLQQINNMNDDQLNVVYNKLLLFKTTGITDLRNICKRYPRALAVDDEVTRAAKSKIVSMPVVSDKLSPDYAKMLYSNNESFTKVSLVFLQKVGEETKDYSLLYKVFSDGLNNLPADKQTKVRNTVYGLIREITTTLITPIITSLAAISSDIRSQLLDEVFVRLLALDLSGVA